MVHKKYYRRTQHDNTVVQNTNSYENKIRINIIKGGGVRITLFSDSMLNKYSLITGIYPEKLNIIIKIIPVPNKGIIQDIIYLPLSLVIISKICKHII